MLTKESELYARQLTKQVIKDVQNKEIDAHPRVITEKGTPKSDIYGFIAATAVAIAALDEGVYPRVDLSE